MAEAENLRVEQVGPARALPSDQSFETVQDVWVALGGPVDPPGWA